MELAKEEIGRLNEEKDAELKKVSFVMLIISSHTNMSFEIAVTIFIPNMPMFIDTYFQ